MLSALARNRLPRAAASRPVCIRQRLALGVLGGTLGGIFLAGLVFLVLDHRHGRAERLERLGDVAKAIAQAPRPGEDVEQRIAVALRAVPWGEVDRVEVYDAERHMLTGYELGVRRFSRSAADAPVEAWPTAVRPCSGAFEGVVAVRGSSYVLLQRTVHLASILVALLACALPLGYVASRRIHASFQRQVLDVVHVANVISSRRDYSIRAVRHGTEEMGLLVDTINHMITQIELGDGQLRKEVARAEAAAVAKAQFLATMSHEIRTPINGVLGMVQLLLDTRLSEEQEEFAGTILTSAEGLLAIINDILDYSKLEAGQVRLEEVQISLSELLKATLEPVSILAAGKGIELCCDVDRGVPDVLRGDPMRMRQVLLNLVGNAIKFTSEGAVVVRVFPVASHGDRSTLGFEVQDTGIGIPADRIGTLFQPFVQVDASHSRRYGGTGLGLAICRQIVEAMGGELHVRSKAGEGSVFGFTLEVQHGVDAAAPRAEPAGLRVLLVEPGPAAREVVGNALRPANDVVAVADAEAALRALAEAPAGFDVVIAEESELAELRRGGGALPEPVIAMATLRRLAAARAAVRDVRGALLTKPVRRDALHRSIDGLLGDDAPPAALPARPSAAPVELPTPLHVLVAEDNPVNQLVITRFLAKLGASCVVVPNGGEAVDAFLRERFDLVLMDIQMPVMDGLAATRRIRALEDAQGLRRTRMAAMTANASAEDRVSAAEAGLDDHLTKPMRWEDLRAYLVGVGATSGRAA